jgi:predicted  nucleic acid-binding Zn-ribbon protein
MDAKDEVEEKKKELNEKIVELNNQFKTIQESAMENLEDLNRQLRENFEKMKVYAEGWFKK